MNGQLWILAALLASGEQYGLELVETVSELSNSQKKISLGGVYTTLHRLEAKGWVEGRWGEASEDRQGARRRYYRITGLGERALSSQANGQARLAVASEV